MIRQVIALGGGGFSMEKNPALDDYVLSAAQLDRPNICFVATASGDSDNYITRFYRRFSKESCNPTHLDLFARSQRDLKQFLTNQDIVYVGGGNTANMLAIWKLHELDAALRHAYQNGVVMAGISAGSICWFESGVSDSFCDLSCVPALGILKGSHCPHYDSESTRRAAYHSLVKDGMVGGIAADDGVALHYINESLERVVTSRPGSHAYRVGLVDGDVVETTLSAERCP